MSKRNINSELSNVFASTYISVAKADTVTSRVVILQNTMFPETEGKSFDLNEFVRNLCEICVYPDDHFMVKAVLSSKHLADMAQSGRNSMSIDVRFGHESYKWVEMSILFSKKEGSSSVYITMRCADREHLLKSIVDRFVFQNCDYFMCLDAKNNSYQMFSSTQNGTPLPSRQCSDYYSELLSYTDKYVALQDREMLKYELNVNRMLENLDKYNEYTIFFGVADPIRGYTRKRLHYSYYDKAAKIILLFRTDVTQIFLEQKIQNQKLAAALERARRDPMTGLYNQQTVSELISDTLPECPRAALMFIDLDNFKRVNDSMGHMAGDEILKKTALILKNSLRSTDICGRIGGDEFVALIKNICSTDEVEGCAQRICQAMQNMSAQCLNGMCVTCSIGIALYPNDGTSYTALLKKADSSVYSAKDNGKSCYSFYSK